MGGGRGIGRWHGRIYIRNVLLVVNQVKRAILSAVFIMIVISIFKYFSTGEFLTAKNIFQIVVTAILISIVNYKIFK